MRTLKTYSWALSFLFVLATMLLSSCGGGGGGGVPTGSITQSITISGTAVNGLISGATVNAYRITAGGAQGSLLATTSTSASGSFSVNIVAYSGPVLLRPLLTSRQGSLRAIQAYERLYRM
jgi:hypothetical protein